MPLGRYAVAVPDSQIKSTQPAWRLDGVLKYSTSKLSRQNQWRLNSSGVNRVSMVLRGPRDADLAGANSFSIRAYEWLLLWL